jgi:hypothetical protein
MYIICTIIIFIEKKMETTPVSNQLQLSANAQKFAAASAYWAKILSIAAIVIIGISMFLYVGIILFTSKFGGLEALILVFVSLVYLVYLLPFYYLLRFAQTMKLALEEENELLLSESLGHLRAFFRVIVILLIAVFALSFIFGISTFLFMDLLN